MSTAPAVATEAEEWISRADAAKLARCSEATINRAVEKRGLETTTGPGGRVMIRLADLIRIGRIKPEDLPTGATGAGTAELRRTQDQLVAAERALGEARGRLAERDTVVATLTGQLAEKDRQIRQLMSILELLGVAVREKAAR